MTRYDGEALERLEPAYLSRWGLAEAPFAPTADDRFFYLDAGRAERLDMLAHLARYGDLVLLVEGAPGAGKTSLMRRFMEKAEADWRLCQVDAHPMLHADALLRHVATGFGLHPLPDDPPALQEALYAHLAGMAKRDLVPILVIDDAHDLPEDALEAVFHLADAESASGRLVRIILFADPQIERLLQAPSLRGLRERITHTLDIPPLGEEQVAEYLRHRLRAAGFKGESPFTPRLIRRIHRASGGLPARVNRLAHTVLRDGRLDESAGGEGEAPPRRAARRLRLTPLHLVLPLLVVAAALGLTFQDEINALFQEQEQPEQPPGEGEALPFAPPGMVAAAPEPGASGGSATPSAGAGPQPAAGQAQPEGGAAKQEAPATPVPVPPPAEPAASPAPGGPRPQTAEGQAAPPILPPAGGAGESSPAPAGGPVRLDSLVPSPVKASTRPQTLKLRGEGFVPGVEVTVRWGGRSKTLPPERVRVLNPNELTFRITTGPRARTWTVSVRNPASGHSDSLAFRVVAARPAPARPPARLREQDWWLAQDPARFTLQLMASGDEAAVRAFLRRHPLPGDTGYVDTGADGPGRYLVLHGSFRDRGAAQRALSALPAALRRHRPWIRRLGQVQARLKAPAPPPSLPGRAPAPAPADPAAMAGWIWSQDPGRFTLQLFASRSEAAARAFIRRHGLSGRAVYFAATRNGQPLYAVILGSHPDRAAALAARAGLPPALRKAAPWARSFASIHAELPPPAGQKSP